MVAIVPTTNGSLASSAAHPDQAQIISLPESTRWLIGQGRNRDAVHMLERIVASDRCRLERMASRLGSSVHFVARVPPSAKPPGFATLFGPASLRSTLLSTMPWFLMDIATYGVGLFTAVLLAEMPFEGRELSPVPQVAALARGTGLIDLFLLLGTTLMVGTQQHVPLVFAGFVVFNLFMNMGPKSIPHILPTELYPTQLRATGAGFAAAVAKIGAALGVFALPLVKSSFGVPTVLALMVIISLLGQTTWMFSMYGHGPALEQHQTQTLPTRHAKAALLAAHAEGTT